MMRINKFLAECGVASRRKAEELIIAGKVKINGRIIVNLSTTINETEDMVMLNGKRLFLRNKEYYLLNKPKGFISSTNDEKNRNTVIDLIKTKAKIFPVGRLDFNTTGVLLLTNDGDFSNYLTHPKNNIPRIYRVKIDRSLDTIDMKKLLAGIAVEGKVSKFAKIEILSEHSKTIKVTTVEGRNHFVKNMFSALGYMVKSLERTQFGNFTVDKIPKGAYRKLGISEIEGVYKKYKYNSSTARTGKENKLVNNKYK